MTDVAGDCVQWTFPADPCAVHTARTQVRGQLHSWRLTPLVDITILLVSELMTNALRYAAGPIGIRLVYPAVIPGALLVEVSDARPDLPCAHAAGVDDEGGRGLQLLACSALRWGTERIDTGKMVWFELSLPG